MNPGGRGCSEMRSHHWTVALFIIAKLERAQISISKRLDQQLSYIHITGQMRHKMWINLKNMQSERNIIKRVYALFIRSSRRYKTNL